MGKADRGSPRWMAKQMRAGGLQRLRWYCQACEKQCRDEHGWRLHTQSPSHVARAPEASKRMSEFSKQFEDQFLLVLKHHSGPVSANRVYNELIQDRGHVRMSATRWPSLTAFMRDLAQHGTVRITATEPELVVLYIDAAAEARKLREAAEAKARRHDLARASAHVIEAQKRAAAAAADATTPGPALVADGSYSDGSDDDDGSATKREHSAEAPGAANAAIEPPTGALESKTAQAPQSAPPRAKIGFSLRRPRS